MVLERVDLEPSPNYTVASIKAGDEDEPGGMYLKPRDIRQFLFCLSPKDIHATNEFLSYEIANFKATSYVKTVDAQNFSKILQKIENEHKKHTNTLSKESQKYSQKNAPMYKDMTNIGKLDMSWRTHMGERGRLQTSPLQRIAPTHGDVRLTVENLPATVPVRKPFTVDCRLYNCCERSLDLRLELQNVSQSLILCSISGISLGQLPPNGNVAFSVEMIPIAIGFQSISGIRIVDSFAKKIYDHDDIAQVFVM
ncbi:unnamed protein product [Cylicostephanus goldi]|uniref:Uncharacterized protein n=1 Tax=Cylicostephanus goldi TaxID=71465 RepID=A0A3P6RHT8_CYLGO|nr:unnamed protein product [Cylicostephanus goldi]